MPASSTPPPANKCHKKSFTARLFTMTSVLALAMFFAGCGSDFASLFGTTASSGCGAIPANPHPKGIARVRHIIVLMQENRSFDNYFGALPYAPGSPEMALECASTDNACVDALTCSVDPSGAITCTNSNAEADGSAT